MIFLRHNIESLKDFTIGIILEKIAECDIQALRDFGIEYQISAIIEATNRFVTESLGHSECDTPIVIRSEKEFSELVEIVKVERAAFEAAIQATKMRVKDIMRQRRDQSS